MSTPPSSGDGSGEADSLDRIAADLRVRKERSGRSYADIARRIAELRIDRGVAASAAQPPRSTISDAFRDGRTWIDPVLLGDIERALGGDEDEAAAWVARSSAVRRGGHRPPARRKTPVEPSILTPPFDPVPARLGLLKPAMLVGAVALNLLGILVVQTLHLPLFLDMIGTAVVAMALGPWHGAGVAVVSNLLGFTVGVPDAMPFALVNLVGALVWGYGVRRARMGDDIRRFFGLNLLAAVACSLVGAPLNVLLFGGVSGHGFDTVTSSFETMGVPLIAATFSSNLLTSVFDKTLVGFLALMVILWLRATVRLPAPHMPLVERLSTPAVARRAPSPDGPTAEAPGR